MTQEKDDDVRKAFRALHDPARPVFHMGMPVEEIRQRIISPAASSRRVLDC
jgi:hypothetical protein